MNIIMKGVIESKCFLIFPIFKFDKKSDSDKVVFDDIIKFRVRNLGIIKILIVLFLF